MIRREDTHHDGLYSDTFKRYMMECIFLPEFHVLLLVLG